MSKIDFDVCKFFSIWYCVLCEGRKIEIEESVGAEGKKG